MGTFTCGAGGGGGGGGVTCSRSVMGNLFCAALAVWAYAHVCMGIKFDMGMLNMSGVCSLYSAAPRCGYIHKAVCGHQ